MWSNAVLSRHSLTANKLHEHLLGRRIRHDDGDKERVCGLL